MTVCSICGDRGYSKQLVECARCQNEAVHRYCIVGPAIFDDKDYKWFCDDCVPSKTGPTSPCRKSGRLTSTVERLASRKIARKKWRKPQIYNHIGALKETPEKVTDPSTVDQKSKSKISNNGLEKESADAADISCPEKEDWSEEYMFNAYKQRNSKLFEEMRIHKTDKSVSRVTDVADPVDNKKIVVEETPGDIVHDQHANAQPNCDDSEQLAARKKRRVVFEVVSSDEEPDFVEAKHPQLVPDVAKHTSTKFRDAHSNFTDDGFGQLSSEGSVPPQPAPRTVADPMLTREPRVRFDSHTFAQQSSGTLSKQVAAQPLVDAAWRGYCNISSDNARPISVVLDGHLSNKAPDIVEGIVCALPGKLEFDLVSKKSAWPKNFEESPPTANGISLYLFPVDERNEKSYDFLVDKMIDNGLMLKSHINKMELLVFCSPELPHEERTLRRKYYLWGLFKPRKDPIMPTTASDFLARNVQSHVAGKYPSDRFHEQKDLGTTRAINTSSDTCLRKDELRSSPEWSRRSQSNSKSFEQPRYNQEYGSPQKYGRDRGVSYRKDDRSYRKFWKPRGRELNYDTRSSDDKRGTRYNRHQSSKWDEQASKQNYQGRRYSRDARRPYDSQM